MFNPQNVVKAPLVIQNIPENACFTTFKELLEALPQYLAVQIPDSITNVIVSNVQPSSSQTTSIWFRTSNSGGFMGIYVFAQGEWHNIYPINDGNQIQMQTFTSLDGTVPEGWTKVETGDPLLPADLVASYVSNNFTSGTGVVQRFWAYFSGF